jgi:hypothetical protein
MNPRIQELQHQAMSSVLNGNDPDGDVERMYIPAEFTKKLAELIVRECAKICMKEFDTGLLMAPQAPWIAKQIKEHFGVKE